MENSLETSESLLLRIQDPRDRDAWYEFVAIYRPLIFRIGQRHGLQEADAQNLVQDVFGKIEVQAEQWSGGGPAGSFRRWLSTVARNAAIDVIRRVRPDAAVGGTSVCQRLQAVSDHDDLSEAEFQRALEREAFRWAARRIRGEFTTATWSAFWQTMVDGRPCGDVADSLGKSLGAVYTARSRVMHRLKQEVECFDWRQAESNVESEGGLS